MESPTSKNGPRYGKCSQGTSVTGVDVRKEARRLRDAVKKNDLELLRQLLSSDDNSIVNVVYSGVTVLQMAVETGAGVDICRVLMSAGADVNVYDNDENSLLNIVADRGDARLVEALVEAGADMEKSNALGLTPLHTAALKGRPDIAQILMNAKCYPNRVDTAGQIALQYCAAEGQLDVARLLLKGEVEINWSDHERRTALIIAVQNGHQDFTKLLIDAGCDLNAVEKYGCSALYFAAKLGHIDIVRQLINAGADINRTDTRGLTAFTVAASNHHMDIVMLLIKSGCDVNVADIENKQTVLHSSVKLASYLYGDGNKHLEMIQTLLSAKCDVNVEDKAGTTPLYQATYDGQTVIVKMLLDAGADVNKLTVTKDTVLHASVFGKKSEITKMLIEAGCNVNNVNNRNELALYSAVVRHADIEIIRLLLEAGSETDICQAQHESPLYAAVEQNYIEAAQLLIAAGCDVNLSNKMGDTPLYLACDKSNLEMVKLLLKQPSIHLDEGFIRVPLHAAAVRGSHAIAECLINAGCQINKLSDVGVSALFLAAENNHLPVAQLLVRWGANPSANHLVKKNSKCCYAFTDAHPHLELEPLFVAVQNDNLSMVKLVLTASPRMPYSALMTLRDILFRTEYAREAQLSQRAIAMYAHFFVGILSRPRSLKEECRGCIRETLGDRPQRSVGQLPLPDLLKNYILLRNETILGNQ